VGTFELAGWAAVGQPLGGLIVGYLWAGIGLAVAAVAGLARVDFHRRARKHEGTNPELARAAREVQRQIDQGKSAHQGFF